MLNESFFKEGFSLVSPYLSPIFYIFVGAAVTSFIDDRRLRKQRAEQMKSIAKSFRSEIARIGEIINPVIKAYRSSGFTVGVPDMIDRNIRETNVDWNNYKPLYDQSGLYYQFRKEINYFDYPIFEQIEEFYTNLISADKCYHEHITCLHNNNQNDITTAWNDQDTLIEYMEKTQAAGSNLKKLLDDYINKN